MGSPQISSDTVYANFDEKFQHSYRIQKHLDQSDFVTMVNGWLSYYCFRTSDLKLKNWMNFLKNQFWRIIDEKIWDVLNFSGIRISVESYLKKNPKVNCNILSKVEVDHKSGRSYIVWR